ncbi:hypothetical protein DKL61_01145 [Gammaproteobacteria bacterium ESL0073]|nr:hypothetical protein DKL61_01145 [Gammaproteobacteria bacterium ESL0073]
MIHLLNIIKFWAIVSISGCFVQQSFAEIDFITPNDKKIIIMGLTLDETLEKTNYPTCAKERVKTVTKITCLDIGFSPYVRFLWDEPTTDGILALKASDKPSFMADPDPMLSLSFDENKKLLFVGLYTKGVEVQDEVIALLIKRFGKPNILINVDDNTPPRTPGMAGSIYAVWDKDDFVIRYVSQYANTVGSLTIGLRRLYHTYPIYWVKDQI